MTRKIKPENVLISYLKNKFCLGVDRLTLVVSRLTHKFLDSGLRLAIRPVVFTALDKMGSVQMRTGMFSTLQLLVLCRVGFVTFAVNHLRKILESGISPRRWGAANALMQIRNAPWTWDRDALDRELWQFLANFHGRASWRKKMLAFTFLRSFETAHSEDALAKRYARELVATVSSSADQDFGLCNAVHYLEGRDSSKWINAFNESFRREALSTLLLTPEQTIRLTDLSSARFQAPKVESGPLVSVILAVNDGAKWLANAVQSIRNQTWQNLEIIIVDDGSTDGTDEIVSEFIASDPRVISLRSVTSLGLFASRNIGLDAAKGEFITTHDADDWSHPQKIERQITPLLQIEKLQATFSQWVRSTEDLLFQPRETVGKFVHLNPNSLMFRSRIVGEIGPWDQVRYSGDREFTERIEMAYGRKSIKLVGKSAMSIGLLHVESLTQRSVSHGLTSYAGFRREYAESFRHWHSRARKDTPQQFAPIDESGVRRFAVPHAMLSPAAENEESVYSVLISGDFTQRKTTKLAIHLLEQCSALGATVAVSHFPRPEHPLRPVNSVLRERISGGDVPAVVVGNRVRCGLWISIGLSRLEITNELLPTIKAIEKIHLETNQRKSLREGVLQQIFIADRFQE